MAKKKKIEIINEELVPTTLAIKKDKKKVSVFGLVWIIFIFGIFISEAFYLPVISQYIINYFNPTDDITPSGNKDNKDNTSTDDLPVEHEYAISDDLEIALEGFKVSNVKVDNLQISMDITNTSESIIEFGKLNYFIILSDGNKKLLQRIMLNDEVVAPGSTVNYKYALVSSEASVIELRNISIEDYPAYVVNADGNGVTALSCTKDYETVKYMLNDNKVYAITDTYVVMMSDPNYSSLYGTYQALASTYANINGVSSVVSVANENLEFKTIINLGSVTTNTLNSKVYYSKDTDAKIMKFELEASGFTCN